jgi:hypothetical protein
MHLKKNHYEINLMLEGVFMSALHRDDADIARKYASLLLQSISTGPKMEPRIVDEETVTLWEERSQWWLEEGRKHGY